MGGGYEFTARLSGVRDVLGEIHLDEHHVWGIDSRGIGPGREDGGGLRRRGSAMTERGVYFDRHGEPVTSEEWARMMEEDAVRRVAETTHPDGKWVSTVYLGLDHNFGFGPPLIFETMVFPSQADMGELDCDRYSTEAEALKGHDRMVEKWTKGADHDD